MINGQVTKLGPRHAGKIVTIVIEDTHYRILHGEDELAVRPRKNTEPITRLYVKRHGHTEGPSRISWRQTVKEVLRPHTDVIVADVGCCRSISSRLACEERSCHIRHGFGSRGDCTARRRATSMCFPS